MSKNRRHMLAAAGLASLLALPLSSHAQAQNELLVGAMTPVTGAGAPYGGNMLKAMEIAAKEVNDAGGMAGRCA